MAGSQPAAQLAQQARQTLETRIVDDIMYVTIMGCVPMTRSSTR
jgi:hypothetical protein